jgi:hypothetical protein
VKLTINHDDEVYFDNLIKNLLTCEKNALLNHASTSFLDAIITSDEMAYSTSESLSYRDEIEKDLHILLYFGSFDVMVFIVTITITTTATTTVEAYLNKD